MLAVKPYRDDVPKFSLMPTVSDPWEAMSEERMARALTGFPPTTTLEAGTSVLSYAEQGKADRIVQWLDQRDRQRFEQWSLSVRHTGEPTTVIHPLAAFLATRRAIAYSDPKGSASHGEVEQAIVKVAVRLNSLVAEPPVSKGTLAGSLTSAMFWMSGDSMRWFHWSYELLSRLEHDGSKVATEFAGATGLTLREWVLRTHGEFAHRYMQGPTAYEATRGIDAELEAAWQQFSATPANEFVEWCKDSDLDDPHDYGPLSRCPILQLDDGRRMPFSRNVLQRATTPNVVAQMLAEITEQPLDQVAALFGKVGERIFLDELASVHADGAATCVLEDAIPGGGKRCEALLNGPELTSGFEVTHITPKRYLSGGADFSTKAYVGRLAEKFEQMLESFDVVAAERSRPRLMCLIQTTPSVWHPLVREAVEQRLSDVQELNGTTFAVVNVFDMLDLLRISQSTVHLDKLLSQWATRHEGYELDHFVHDIDPGSTGLKGDSIRFDASRVTETLQRTP